MLQITHYTALPKCISALIDSYSLRTSFLAPPPIQRPSIDLMPSHAVFAKGGLGHFEGRGWRGFHHHATLCIAAFGFLISERETIPPSGDLATTLFPQFAVREGYQPRQSVVAARTPRSELDCNNAPEIGGALATTLSRCPSCAARNRHRNL